MPLSRNEYSDHPGQTTNNKRYGARLSKMSQRDMPGDSLGFAPNRSAAYSSKRSSLAARPLVRDPHSMDYNPT